MSLSQLLRSAVKFLGYPYRLVISPLGAFLLAFLPAPLAYGLARFYGDWRYQRDTVERETVMSNLAAILGEQLSPEERVCVTRDYFRLRSCEAVDMKRLAGKGRALTRLVELRGQEHLEAALVEGKGAILCGAHFGAYFAVPSLLLKKGFSITAVTRLPAILDRSLPLTVRLLWQRICSGHLFSRMYQSSIQLQPGKPYVAIRIANILRTNGVIVMGIDPPPLAVDRPRAVPVAFLGRQVRLLSGSATLAHLTGASVLMFSLRRSADWRHQVLEISPPISMDGDVVEAFGRCVGAIEALILREPAHWPYWSQSAKLVELGLLPTTDEVATAAPLLTSR